MKRKSRKQYEEYLNELSPSYSTDELWIIGDKDRRQYYYPNKWGKAIRKHDPIGFNVGYNEWLRS
jgi:hypothetical protein